MAGLSGWRRPLRFRWPTFTHLFQSQLRETRQFNRQKWRG